MHMKNQESKLCVHVTATAYKAYVQLMAQES